MTLKFLIAIAVLFGLILFLFHEVRRGPGPPRWGRSPVWLKRLRITFASLLLFAGLLAFWAFFIEPNRLIVRHETIQVNNWPKELSGLKIAVMADIHAGSAFIDDRKLRSIVERTNQLQPELIVILGDFMSGHGRDGVRFEPEAFAAILKDFRAPLGVYAVMGNHDWWHDGNRVVRALEANGINVLDDKVAEVQGRTPPFWLAGLADLWTRPQRIDQTIARVPAGQPIIALTHNPDVFPRLPERVQLLLAGHTHGGQVKLPIIGTAIHPSDYGDRYVSGHVVENNHHLFVTTGIGTSIMPVRFAVPPEIVLLTVEAKVSI